MTVWRRVARLKPGESALLVDAALLLVRSRIALWLLPWRRVVSRLRPSPVASSRSRFSVDRLEWAIKAASRAVPGATCLTQAIALSRLLARNGHASIVQIGVTKADGPFAAHAWVECEGVPLLSTAAELTRYARFVAWPPPPHLFR